VSSPNKKKKDFKPRSPPVKKSKQYKILIFRMCWCCSDLFLKKFLCRPEVKRKKSSTQIFQKNYGLRLLTSLYSAWSFVFVFKTLFEIFSAIFNAFSNIQCRCTLLSFLTPIKFRCFCFSSVFASQCSGFKYPKIQIFVQV